MKRIVITLTLIISSSFAYTQVYTGSSSVVALTINDSEPIIRIRGIRNYNIYSITVDSVLLINVGDALKVDYSETYLHSCKYLTVCLDSSQYYQSKTDWITGNKYIVESDVGIGIGDLSFYKIGEETLYIADPFSIKASSWVILPQSIIRLLLTPLHEKEKLTEMSITD